jgi:hypothetical protein
MKKKSPNILHLILHVRVSLFVFRIINASVYIKERDKMPEEGQIWQD